MKLSIIPLVIAIFGATASASPAESTVENCKFPDSPAAFKALIEGAAGDWTMSHYSGYMAGGPMIMPFGAAGDREPVRFHIVEDTLAMSSPQVAKDLIFRRPLAGEWPWIDTGANAQMPAPSLPNNELARITECNDSNLGRMIGEGQVHMNGMLMDFTYRLVIADTEKMYGIMHVTAVVNAIPMVLRRTLGLTR